MGLVQGLGGYGNEFINEAPGLLVAASLPLLAMAQPDRRDLTEKIESYIALANEDLKLPLWEMLGGKSRSDKFILDLRSTTVNQIRYSLLTGMAQSLITAGKRQRIVQAHTEAATVLVALEIHRRREGHYPDSLEQLAPRYFPTTPIDHSTGEPLLMKLVDGRPLLYGRGMNKVDDGGTLAAIKPGVARSEIPFEGDWILYPPVTEPMTAPATQPAPP